MNDVSGIIIYGVDSSGVEHEIRHIGPDLSMANFLIESLRYDRRFTRVGKRLVRFGR